MRYNINLICPAISNYVDVYDDTTIETKDSYIEAIEYAQYYRNTITRNSSNAILYVIPADREYNNYILENLIKNSDQRLNELG